MTWSFDDTLPTAKDRIRDLIGDINEATPILSDESIGVYLAGGAQEQANESLAAACCLEKMAARVAGRATSISEGGSSVSWGDIAKRYREQAAQLRSLDAVGDGSGLFEIAEFAVDEFSARELLRNDLLRSGF
jgi:hypothetical protein